MHERFVALVLALALAPLVFGETSLLRKSSHGAMLPGDVVRTSFNIKKYQSKNLYDGSKFTTVPSPSFRVEKNGVEVKGPDGATQTVYSTRKPNGDTGTDKYLDLDAPGKNMQCSSESIVSLSRLEVSILNVFAVFPPPTTTTSTGHGC